MSKCKLNWASTSSVELNFLESIPLLFYIFKPIHVNKNPVWRLQIGIQEITENLPLSEKS
jgi:hypothetical protein